MNSIKSTLHTTYWFVYKYKWILEYRATAVLGDLIIVFSFRLYALERETVA